MNRLVLISVALSLVAAAIVDLISRPAGDAALLLSTLFWMGLAQGAVALVAAVRLSRGRWLDPLRDTLLGLWPVLALFPILLALFGRDLSAYGWSHHPTAWLSPGFLIARNVLAQIVILVIAERFARAVKTERESANAWAVAYLLVFVAVQTMTAVDWIMSFEYPFISTMFGPLFFVESFWLGVTLAAALAAVLCLSAPDHHRGLMRDAATLMFGFSLLWAGLTYAQYLTIWYGNLPEETSYFLKRLPYAGMFWYVVCSAFVVPFPALLARRMRSTPAVVLATAGLITSGLFVERVWNLVPVVSVSWPLAAIQTAIIGTIIITTLVSEIRRRAS
jgi:hypothetical protein